MNLECKFCQSNQINSKRQIISLINKQPYDLYECNDCKSQFFNANQYPIELNTMYNELSNREIFPVDFTFSKKWITQKRTINKILKTDPKSILDVGCRTGDFLMHYKSNIVREGVELSIPFVKIGAERGLKIYNDFLEKIDFQNTYDIVSCYAILEHLEFPIEFLEKLHSIVNKNGVLVIMVPTYQSLKVKIHNITKTTWHMYSPPEHLNLYSRSFLDKFMEEKGFVLMKRNYTSGGMNFYNGNIMLLKKIESLLNKIIDSTFLNKLPIFDHMYSFYKKK